MNAVCPSFRRFRLWTALALAAGSLTGVRAADGIRAPRIIQTVTPEFPAFLLNRGIYDGEARIIVVIDAEGHLVDWMLRSYSHPLLAREATEALRQWRFEPASVDGQPVDTRTEIVFLFRASGMVTVSNANDITERIQKVGANQAVRQVCPAAELDEPVKVIKAVRPLALPPAEASRRGGRAVVDFYIDAKGLTRMPVVKQADDDLFADAAIEAISHWRFTVPTHNGIPVTTHAVQSFRFDPVSDGAAPTAQVE
jgi:TonB family protein